MANKDARMRFNRACRLVMEEGTRSVRDFVMANLNPWRRDGLPGTLRPLRELIEKLRDKSTITADQFDVLYPPTGDPINVDDIDLTLWVILLRNATCVSDKAINKKDSKVTDLERTCRADVMCIKETRNALFHKSRYEMDEEEFDQLWRTVSCAILRLSRAVHGDSEEEQQKVNGTLKTLETGDLDKSATERSICQLQIQSLGDMRHIAMQEATRKRSAYVVLVVQLVLTFIIIAGMAIAMWKYVEANQTCIKSVKYISTNGGLINYMPRYGWGAQTPKEPLTPLKTPVKYVIVTHTAVLSRCSTTEECCDDTNKVQYFNMHTSGFFDIAFNYMVGDSGVILEGRGSDVYGSAARGWNNESLSFAFMGLYKRSLPSEEALEAMQNFLGYLVTIKKLQNNYIIYGLCQVRPFALSPGARLYREIQTWPHWRNNSGDSNCKHDAQLRHPVYKFAPIVKVLGKP